jgi:hypothetical protein
MILRLAQDEEPRSRAVARAAPVLFAALDVKAGAACTGLRLNI